MKNEKRIYGITIIKAAIWSAAAALFVILFVQKSIFITAKEMDLSYSRSVNSFGDTWAKCYVYDNTLYYMNETNPYAGTRTIQYSEDGLVYNLVKLVDPGDKFLIVDKETAVVSEYGNIYIFHTAERKRTDLCSGQLVGFCNERLYYIDNNTLYGMDIVRKVIQPVATFDSLLASYYDGIVYETDGCIYSLRLEMPAEPALLTDEKIELPKSGVWFEGDLYTEERIIRVTETALDVYTFRTGQIERIYEADLDSNILQMAVTVHENVMYVSMQRTDIKLWPVEDPEINGIYRYDFDTGEWTKVSSKTYGTLMQFDEDHLYGVNEHRLFNLGNIEKIPLE